MSSKSDRWVKTHKFPDNCWACQKELMPNAKIVFDIGASTGGRIIGRYLEMYPQATVYAFEPAPEQYAGLLKQLPKYGDNAGERVKPFCAAVLDYDGVASFHLSSLPATHSVLETLPRESLRTIEVNVIALDTFCGQKGIDRIDILKVDAEGTDHLVLKGAEGLFKAGKVGLVYIELNYHPIFKDQCWAWDIVWQLEEYGFKYHSQWGDSSFLGGHMVINTNAIFVPEKVYYEKGWPHLRLHQAGV